jgi:hypothetical protein
VQRSKAGSTSSGFYRAQIFDALARVVAEQGVVTRDQLSAFPVGDATRRLIDQSRGIWMALVVPSPPDGILM